MSIGLGALSESPLEPKHPAIEALSITKQSNNGTIRLLRMYWCEGYWLMNPVIAESLFITHNRQYCYFSIRLLSRWIESRGTLPLG